MPVLKTKEDALVKTLGLDAALFLRFTAMCRNIFLCLTVVGCGILIPVNFIGGKQERSHFKGISFYNAITPQYMYGNGYWAFIVCAYVFDIIICFFLWWNYRAVVRLRRAYFNSAEYQASLYARTLLLTDIARPLRSDQGILDIVDSVKGGNMVRPTPAIARDVKGLPDLVSKHNKTVRELEEVLAKYLKDPEKLPAHRPTCKATINGPTYRKGEKVDAIQYLTDRIKTLEQAVQKERQAIDARDTMSYGFASYQDIAEAHTQAYAARGKSARGATVKLAPRPIDLIWRNLGISKSQRRRKNFVSNIWVAILTLVWIAPSVLIAVFLANLSNLGLVWPAFRRSLEKSPKWWAIVQGVVAPGLTTLFYLYLPAIFRKLCIRAGDVTKTSRERHVMHKLYSFFVFNNLVVFSLFAAVWGFVASVVKANQSSHNLWEDIKNTKPFSKIMTSLVSVSPYWMAWLLQRNLGAAVDLAQLLTLTWGSFSRRFLSPTPRQVIELSAPQPFDYSGYYNYFLFYATVAICFATLQPLVLPVTAFYFCIDTYMKRYLLLYIFITKTESGGAFWTVLYNRFILLTILGNAVVALVVVAQGNEHNWAMLGTLAPLPFLVLAFKWYCAFTFDKQLQYYTKQKLLRDEEQEAHRSREKGSAKVGVRFGNPVLYKPLITPMVLAKSKHLLNDIYTGRTSLDDHGSGAGYSDVYMDTMDKKRPGKQDEPTAPFELVHESELDFEHFKARSEFGDEFGGNGELYGRAQDLSRPSTPGSMMTKEFMPRSKMSSPALSDASPQRKPVGGNGIYQALARAESPSRRQSPAASPGGYRNMPGFASQDRGVSPARAALLRDAGMMGDSPPPVNAPGWHHSQAYAARTPEEEATSYDYFRHQ